MIAHLIPFGASSPCDALKGQRFSPPYDFSFISHFKPTHTMKTTHRIIVCLIALICFCAPRAAADSPLTSTKFPQAYADEPIVAQVEKGRTPSD